MTDWQPIETAPKDGTWVLLRGGTCAESDPHRGPIPAVVSFWDGSDWVFAYWDMSWGYAYENPTHWMPLPAPPITEPVDAWANGYT